METCARCHGSVIVDHTDAGGRFTRRKCLGCGYELRVPEEYRTDDEQVRELRRRLQKQWERPD